MKCLISVIAHNEEPFIKLENGIRETWMKHNVDFAQIFKSHITQFSSTKKSHFYTH